MTALAELCEAPGLEAYLADLEDRLDHAVGTYRGIVSEVGGEALAAGGKRLGALWGYVGDENVAAYLYASTAKKNAQRPGASDWFGLTENGILATTARIWLMRQISP